MRVNVDRFRLQAFAQKLKLLSTAAATVFFSVSVTVGAAAPKYSEPHPSGFGVNADNLSITENSKKAAAGTIYGYLATGKRLSDKELKQASKLLGIALLLKPDHKDCVLMNARLRRGELPRARESTHSKEKLADIFVAIAKHLKSKGGRDNTRFAGFLLDIASQLHPDHEDALYLLELYRKKHGPVQWDPVFNTDAKGKEKEATAADNRNGSEIRHGAHPAYLRKVKHPERRQSKIKGLMVLNTGQGLLGKAVDIILTLYAYHKPDAYSTGFERPVGRSMVTSNGEAVNAVRVRYPHWPGAKKFSFSFGDKYSAKDGGSAGMAFSLLLLSLFDDIDIDPDFAVTGDITVDWKIREVGGVGAKIRGAMLDEVPNVIIPAGCEKQVADMALIYPAEQLWKVQIFAADTLGDAVSIIRTDRDENIQECMDLFNKIRKYLSQKGTQGLYDHQLLQALNKIYKQYPNHLSAEYLLRMQAGKLPNKLSPNTALQEISFIARPFMIFAIENGPIHRLDIPMEQVKKIQERMEKMEDAIPETLSDLYSAVNQSVESFHTYRKTINEVKELNNSLNRRRVSEAMTALHNNQNSLRKQIQEMNTDLKLMEALR